MNEHPNLQTFEGWADVAARLRGQSAEAQAARLASLGLSAAWPQADQYWRAVLVEDIAAGNDARPRHFRQVCHAMQSALHAAPMPAPASQASPPPSSSAGHYAGAPASQASPPPPSAAVPYAPAPNTTSTPQPAAPAAVAPITQSVSPWSSQPVATSPSPAVHGPAGGGVSIGGPAPATRTAQFAAAPPVAIDAGAGFRQQLMHGVNTQPAPRSSAVPNGGSFVAQLSTHTHVTAPTHDQTSTTGIGADSAQAAMGATEALKWSVERYAEVTAEAEREPHRQELVWAKHGVIGKHLPRVLKRWRKRFEEEPALEAQWRSLVDHHLQGG